MQHCLCIDDLDTQTIQRLMDNACSLIDVHTHNMTVTQSAAGRTVIMLFYEPSTRTHMSFTVAAHRCGASVQSMVASHSSEQKGESVQDTILSLAAMRPDALVVRHSQAGILQTVVDDLPNQAHLINAGDGDHAHPTQALLDAATIQQSKGSLAPLNIAIVGDSRHSRSAHSEIACFIKLGVQSIRLIAPEAFRYQSDNPTVTGTEDWEALCDCDVVIVHRLQQERLSADIAAQHNPTAMELTAKHFAMAKPDAILMHPGPVNWGHEIAAELKAHPHALILQQIQMGVAMRMALFSELFND